MRGRNPHTLGQRPTLVLVAYLLSWYTHLQLQSRFHVQCQARGLNKVTGSETLRLLSNRALFGSHGFVSA